MSEFEKELEARKRLDSYQPFLPGMSALLNDELNAALKKFPKMNSYHEGYAVILEELDELWEEVKKNPTVRDPNAVRAEAIQVAAMACRFIMDLCLGGR